jgi:hypothetical protein
MKGRMRQAGYEEMHSKICYDKLMERYHLEDLKVTANNIKMDLN